MSKPVLKIDGIDHLVLRTDNMKVMLDFYQNVLNCQVVRDEWHALGLVQLQAGSELIDLLDVDSEMGKKGGKAAGAQDNNLDHFCLRLARISNRDLRDYLQSSGVEVPGFENRNGAQGFGDSIYISDPDGNTIELKSST